MPKYVVDRPQRSSSKQAGATVATSAQVFVAALASLCLVSSCASDVGRNAGTHDPVSARLKLSAAVPQGMRALPWSLIHASGREIRVSVSKSGCTFPRGFAVATSKDAVVITAYGQRAAGFCTSDMTTAIETLVLSAPLGARRLVHRA
jgi:hypothetical protein